MRLSIMYDFCYINKPKVDLLFSQVNGSLVEEQKEHSRKDVKGVGKMGLELGGILAKLGLAKGTGDAEIAGNYSRLHEVTSSLSPANKINVIREFHSKRGALADVMLTGKTSQASLLKDIGGSEVQLFQGSFRLAIDGVSASDVTGTIIHAMGHGYKHLKVPKNGTLQSIITTDDPKVPLIVVPILFEHILTNQAFAAYAADSVPLIILGNTLASSDHFAVNPIAIAMRY